VLAVEKAVLPLMPA
jgi:hypothetical protein